MLSVFDAPQPEPNCEARSASTVAPQSLALMNSKFILDHSAAFAERIRRESPGDLSRQAARAWRLAYGSAPSGEDVRELTVYLDQQTKLLAAAKKPGADPATLALASLCQVLLESNRFLYVD
jgi:hypothetical protein